MKTKRYWDTYYKTNKPPEAQSLFAEFCLSKLKEKYKDLSELSLVDCGAGNARDSIFFAKNGLDEVVALDQTTKGFIDQNLTNLTFQQGDFPHVPTWIVDVIYSRFSLHAITSAQEKMFLNNAYKRLKHNGTLMIETRSIDDPHFGIGKIPENDVSGLSFVQDDGHYRRFADLGDLCGWINYYGFKHIEVWKDKGFAPHGDEDPEVIRIVAHK
jgi:SAM-dependent methyltransferase